MQAATSVSCQQRRCKSNVKPRMMLFVCLGLFLVSVSVLDASHIIRQRDETADVALNSTFQGGVHTVSGGLMPLTGSTNTERRRRDDSSNIVRRDVALSVSRRRRRNKRQNGMSNLHVQANKNRQLFVLGLHIRPICFYSCPKIIK